MSGGLILALLAFGALYLGAFGRWLVRIDPKVNFWLAIIGIVSAIGVFSGGDEHPVPSTEKTPLTAPSRTLPMPSLAVPSTIRPRLTVPSSATLPETPRLTFPVATTAPPTTAIVNRSEDGVFRVPSSCYRFEQLVTTDAARFAVIC